MPRVIKASGGTEGRKFISNGFFQGKYTVVKVIVIFLMEGGGGVKTAMSVHNVEHNLNFKMYYQ